MVEDDLPARIGRDSALFVVAREDLDPYSVEDLRLRIEMLEAEIARSRAAMDSKTHRRSAADALFSFKGS